MDVKNTPLQEQISHRVAFGEFEADLRSEELWRNGVRVNIQRQPFQLLGVLLRRPGELVIREELQRELWGDNVNVDYDHSLNAAINKIREALEDAADSPQYIQTLARRGYRFLATVTAVSQSDPLIEYSARGVAICKAGRPSSRSTSDWFTPSFRARFSCRRDILSPGDRDCQILAVEPI